MSNTVIYGHCSATDTKATKKGYVALWLKSLLQKYPLLMAMDLFPFYVDFFLSSIIDNTWPNLTIYVTRLEFYYLPLASTWVDPRFLVGSALLIFSVFCILVFFFVCLRLVSRVHTVTDVSELSILDCLFRLSLTFIWL